MNDTATTMPAARDGALRALLPGYGLPSDAPLRLLNLSENATFQAGAGPDALILRLHRAGYHSHAEIASELAWLEALRHEPGLRCVRPVSARDGSLIQMAGEQAVVAFVPIAGREPRPEDDLPPWFDALGEITARLHRHARRWALPAGFTRKRWDVETILGPRPHWGDWRAAPGCEGEAHAVLHRLADDLAARLAAYGTGPEVFGLVHADLRLANLLIDDAGLWAIDFDDCGFSWWIYDFAAAVSFIETDPRLPDLAESWVSGYTRVAPLPAPAVAMLPVMVMLRRLLLTAWLGSRAESDTAAEFGGPAYTLGSADLAERFLTRGAARFWG
ncbi:MAG: phosphotransferase enzyme family protein [Pararhodobacter sp.]